MKRIPDDLTRSDLDCRQRGRGPGRGTGEHTLAELATLWQKTA